MSAVNPSFGDLILAVVRSDLPVTCVATLTAIISWGDFKEWEPRYTSIDKIAQRAKFKRRAVSEAIDMLVKFGLVTNIGDRGCLPHWQIHIEAVMSLPDTKHEYAEKPVKESKTITHALHAQPHAPGAHVQPTHQVRDPMHVVLDSHAPGARPHALHAQPHAPGAHISQNIPGSYPQKDIPRIYPDASSDAQQMLINGIPLKAETQNQAVEAEEVKPSEVKIPKMLESISQRADIGSWVSLWSDMKPNEREVFLDAVEIWDAYESNCEHYSKGLSITRYRMLRQLLKTYDAKTLCLVPAGVKNHGWSKETGKTNEFDWMFQLRNIEKFAALAQNKTSKTDGLGRMQHGDDMGEIWTFKKTRS